MTLDLDQFSDLSMFAAQVILYVVFISHLVIYYLYKTNYLVCFVPETLNNFQLNWLTVLAKPSSVACGTVGDEVDDLCSFYFREDAPRVRERGCSGFLLRFVSLVHTWVLTFLQPKF